MSATIYSEVDPPVYAAAWHFFISLISQADTNIFQANPTLAAGDVKVSIDGGSLNNLATLPSATPAASKLLRVDLSAAEMTGNQIMVLFSDAADSEWQDAMVMISTMSLGVLSQTASSAVAAMTGSDLAMVCGITYSTTISGLTIPATWSKIYFTVKDDLDDSDAASVLQITDLATPDAAIDGIVYLNGVAATVTTRAYGSLVINQAGGTVAITVTDEGTALIPTGKYSYDLKCILAAGTTTQLSSGGYCTVELTETRS